MNYNMRASPRQKNGEIRNISIVYEGTIGTLWRLAEVMCGEIW